MFPYSGLEPTITLVGVFHARLKNGGIAMGFIQVSGLLAGIVAIVAGVIIMIWPRIIAYIIGIWLVIVGILAVINALR